MAGDEPLEALAVGDDVKQLSQADPEEGVDHKDYRFDHVADRSEEAHGPVHGGDVGCGIWWNS